MTRVSNLENIARCQHIKTNGVQCGSPARRNRRYCYFHDSWHRSAYGPRRDRHKNLFDSFFTLPLEDANSIQIALTRVLQEVYVGRIELKTAGLMLYALQLASANLRHVNFDPPPGPDQNAGGQESAIPEHALSSGNDTHTEAIGSATKANDPSGTGLNDRFCPEKPTRDNNAKSRKAKVKQNLTALRNQKIDPENGRLSTDDGITIHACVDQDWVQ